MVVDSGALSAFASLFADLGMACAAPPPGPDGARETPDALLSRVRGAAVMAAGQAHAAVRRCTFERCGVGIHLTGEAAVAAEVDAPPRPPRPQCAGPRPTRASERASE